MASTYLRRNSPFIWMRFKDATGQWRSKPTRYRKENPGDRRQAKLLAEKMSIEEREKAAGTRQGGWDWVDGWLLDRYGKNHGTTVTVYRRYWRRLRPWLLRERLAAPHLLTYPDCLRYKEERAESAGINTIIHELKFLGVVMGEAVHRLLAPANPCVKLGLKRDPVKGKEPWRPEQVRAVAAALPGQSAFIQASFILGYYQAARLRQCAVPLKDINLAGRRITYWKTLEGRPLTKGNKPFTQPLARAALPLLRALIARREAEGQRALCEVPVLPSVEWRRFLDSLGPGFREISHHGLRATWITQAALSREKISREEAKAFVNHGSTAVHEIYQRLNADDVAHVADALALPDLSRPARPRKPARAASP